ncbi:hypothetical protein TWF506_001586 [Arthrobotrys conoides]|uniref:F-box domain-containing protein n=1 Tax=Arthrobotrys conoides TaxID=74498 RepID=A0AAN8NNS4_9PEZI
MEPIPPLIPETKRPLTLAEMPIDLKYEIIESCDAVSFVSLSKTCKSFYDIFACQYGKTIYLNLLKHGMCKQSWLIYKIDKIRGQQRKWEEEQTRERKFLYRHLSAPGADSLFSQMQPREPFPLEEVVRNYKIPEEFPESLIKELYRIQETVQYFTKRFRSTKFDINGTTVWVSDETKIMELPSLSDFDDEDLHEVFYYFWLALMLFRGLDIGPFWKSNLNDDDDRSGAWTVKPSSVIKKPSMKKK